MLTSLTTIDLKTGTLIRYEVGGQPRKTHECIPNPDVWVEGESVIEADFLKKFMGGFLGEFYCGALIPIPGGDNPGGTPGSVHAPTPLAA